MLHSISWGQFSLVIFIGLAVYYGYVLIRYYGQGMQQFAQGNKNRVDEKVTSRERAQPPKEPAKGGPAGVVVG
jgi:hypothetical protein